jgi:hypothetical protein
LSWNEFHHALILASAQAPYPLIQLFLSGHIAIPASLALANMHTLIGCVNVADLESQSFPQSQTHAVKSKEIYALAQSINTVDQ